MDNNMPVGNMNGMPNGGMPNQSMRNGQMMGVGQPMMNGAPMMNQMKPPKPPMDPAKKKKIITGVILGVGGVVAAIVVVVVLMIVLKVDYGESYRIAKELKSDIYNFTSSSSCRNVVSEADSAYVEMTTYEGYVNACRSGSDGLMDEMDKLGSTPGVMRNAEIKTQYEKVRQGLETVLPNQEDLEKKLDIYLAWHKFVVLADPIRGSSPDSLSQTAAKALTDSGNTILKTYGEGWLEKWLTYAHAYQAYDNASWRDDNYSALRQVSNDTYADYKTWKAENCPDIKAVAEIKLDNLNKIYDEYKKLYEMIKTEYENNYNSESGDCIEFLGEVVCE